MVHILIVSHGKLADALLDSARMIVGESFIKGIDCLSMTEEKSMDQFCLEVRNLLDLNPKDEYLILADIFGASPCNSCLSAFRNANYRLISGVNLPMLLELLMAREEMELSELWNKTINCGKESIKGVYLPPQ